MSDSQPPLGVDTDADSGTVFDLVSVINERLSTAEGRVILCITSSAQHCEKVAGEVQLLLPPLVQDESQQKIFDIMHEHCGQVGSDIAAEHKLPKRYRQMMRGIAQTHKLLLPELQAAVKECCDQKLLALLLTDESQVPPWQSLDRCVVVDATSIQI